MNSTLKVLLDSTYLLPSFGIEVKRLSDEDIKRLRRAVIEGRIKLYCLSIVWVEVLGKVCREAQRLRRDIKEILEIAVKSLLESGFYTWIEPAFEAVKLAFELRMLGHKDIIDNLLYATSVVNKMIFLTMDDELKKFLSKKNYKVDNLMNHEQLFSEIV